MVSVWFSPSYNPAINGSKQIARKVVIVLGTGNLLILPIDMNAMTEIGFVERFGPHIIFIMCPRKPKFQLIRRIGANVAWN